MDTLDYLKRVTSDPEEAQRLSGLGADSPEALLAMIMANPAAFDAFVGQNSAVRIIRSLRAIVPPDRQTDALTSIPGRLGVPLRPGPPKPLEPKFDIGQRDQLFNQLQHLRRMHAPEHEVKKIEHALDSLMRGTD